MQALEREELLSNNNFENQRAIKLLQSWKRELKGLDRAVSRQGFIYYKDYLTKLKMMDEPMFLFGLKLFDMPGAVEFYDADFCNTLVIKSIFFED
jgi:hypothetical protein